MNILQRQTDPRRVDVVQDDAQAPGGDAGQVDVGLQAFTHRVGEHCPEVIGRCRENSPVSLKRKKRMLLLLLKASVQIDMNCPVVVAQLVLKSLSIPKIILL